jgi:hypothetical protein
MASAAPANPATPMGLASDAKPPDSDASPPKIMIALPKLSKPDARGRTHALPFVMRQAPGPAPDGRFGEGSRDYAIRLRARRQARAQMRRDYMARLITSQRGVRNGYWEAYVNGFRRNGCAVRDEALISRPSVHNMDADGPHLNTYLHNAGHLHQLEIMGAGEDGGGWLTRLMGQVRNAELNQQFGVDTQPKKATYPKCMKAAAGVGGGDDDGADENEEEFAEEEE